MLKLAIWAPALSNRKTLAWPSFDADQIEPGRGAQHRVGDLRVGDEHVAGRPRQVDDDGLVDAEIDGAVRRACRRRRASCRTGSSAALAAAAGTRARHGERDRQRNCPDSSKRGHFFCSSGSGRFHCVVIDLAAAAAEEAHGVRFACLSSCGELDDLGGVGHAAQRQRQRAGGLGGGDQLDLRRIELERRRLADDDRLALLLARPSGRSPAP